MADSKIIPVGRPRKGKPARSEDRVCVACGSVFRAQFHQAKKRFCSRACILRYAHSETAFWLKVQKTEGGCWMWTGAKSPRGYGRVRLGDRTTVAAHRRALEFRLGTPIPAGLFACHHCDTPGCVNPDHLYLGTPTENMVDMSKRGRACNQNDLKTHCPRGHEYSGRNLIVSKRGWRYCRICRDNHARDQQRAKREKKRQMQERVR